MLVAIDLALHLNDSAGTLQAVVNCYGLLAPLIFNQIPSEPVIKVTTFRIVLDNTCMSVQACLSVCFECLFRFRLALGRTFYQEIHNFIIKSAVYMME